MLSINVELCESRKYGHPVNSRCSTKEIKGSAAVKNGPRVCLVAPIATSISMTLWLNVLSVLRLAPNVPNTNGNSGKNIWQHVGIDLLHLERHDYVLIIYYYCRFRGVVTLGTILAEVVDAMFKSSFARFGTAYSMQTDNRAQFAFKEFADLELAYGFHEISNPRYHHAMR